VEGLGVAGDNLRIHDGRHVGRFHDDEIYGPDGYYLGEVRSGNRLVGYQDSPAPADL
jgi:hypothetical protein